MAELVAVKNVKPAVEKITVELTKSEAIDLAKAYRGYYGYGSTGVVKVLEDAANGKSVPLPRSFTDYLAKSVMSNSTF